MNSDLEESLARQAAANEKAEARMRKLGTPIAIAVCVVALAWVGYKLMFGESEHDACVKRGISYFKEIGSYPYLSDHRDADLEAKERCRRTTTAFPK